MDELNPRLGGVSFFRPRGARAYEETDSIVPRRRDRYRRVHGIVCAMAKPARQCARSWAPMHSATPARISSSRDRLGSPARLAFGDVGSGGPLPPLYTRADPAVPIGRVRLKAP